jgi:hypothetical protein
MSCGFVPPFRSIPLWVVPAGRTPPVKVRALAPEDTMVCAAALCFRSRPITAEFPPSPPGMVPVGFTSTERAKADEINRLDFHFLSVSAGLLLPRIKDVAVRPWIGSPSSWAKVVPQHSQVSSRISVRFLRICLLPFISWPHGLCQRARLYLTGIVSSFALGPDQSALKR